MSFDKRAFWQDLLTNKTPPKATAFLGFELIAFDPDAGWVEAAFTLPEHATNPGGDAQGGSALFTRGEMTREDGTLLAQATASCIPRALPSGT